MFAKHQVRKMKISIFGLSYVGAVLAGCLAKNGCVVIGANPAQTKVSLFNDGSE